MSFTPSEALASKARSMLRALRASQSGIEAAAVVSNDGLMLASILGSDTNPDRFAAMCASLLALAKRAALEVNRGDLRQVILDGELGPVLLTQAGSLGVLAIAAQPTGMNLGQLILESRKTARDLAQLNQPL